MKKINELLFLTLIVGLCSCHHPIETATTKSFSIPGNIAARLELGQAYDSLRARHIGVSCVEGIAVADLLDQRSTLEYSRDSSYEKIVRDISGELSAGASFPSIAVTGLADYASENSSTDFKETHHVLFRYSGLEKFRLGTIQIKDGMTNASGLCGNEFINQIEVGALFHATLSIEFENRADKQRLAGSLKIDALAGTIQVEGALQEADASTKQRIRIRLSALQEGGDPSLLATVLSPDLASCSVLDLNPCILAFKALITYGQNISAQLDQNDNLAVLSYLTESYEESGLDDLIPDAPASVPLDVQMIRSEIEQKLASQRSYVDRIEFLRDGLDVHTTANRIKILNHADTLAKSNINVLEASLNFCYENPLVDAATPSCQSNYESSLKNVRDLDMSLLEGDS